MDNCFLLILKRIRLILPVVPLVFNSPSLLIAETPQAAFHSESSALPQITPQICAGYFPNEKPNLEKHWGHYSHFATCPKNSAIYSAVPAAVSSTLPPSQVRFMLGCCPLPAPDILTGEIQTHDFECPKNFIATGLIVPKSVKTEFPDSTRQPGVWQLRCEKINTNRYQLGEDSPGVYWGFGSTFLMNQRRYAKTDIPPALRYGVGRLSRYIWRQSGCIGKPFGGLLAKKTSKRCHGQFYRQLQFVGLPGDPSNGTPVQMFPDCRDISEPTEPNITCLK